jgi:putative DNA primase/helicase
MSMGVELLADIKELFDHNRTEKISTAALITGLCDDDEKPWATYNRGKPITPRQVSKRLSEYGIKSKGLRIGLQTPKGFEIDQFKEAFNRYLGDLSATPQQAISINGLGVADKKPLPKQGGLSATPKQNVSEYPQRCGNGNQSATPQPTAGAACGVVADKMGETAINADKVVRI